MHISFASVDPGWGANKVGPCGYAEGTHEGVRYDGTTETLDDGRAGNGGPGTIDVHIVGTLTVTVTGANWDYAQEGIKEWHFAGKIFADDNMFDFERHNPPRSGIKEHVTTVIRNAVPGASFKVYIEGSRSIDEKGSCCQ